MPDLVGLLADLNAVSFPSPEPIKQAEFDLLRRFGKDCEVNALTVPRRSKGIRPTWPDNWLGLTIQSTIPPNGGSSDSESNVERLIVDNETQAGRLCLYGAKETLDAAAGETVISLFCRGSERFWRASIRDLAALRTSGGAELNQGVI